MGNKDLISLFLHMGLTINSLEDLLSVKILVKGSESVIYGMTVSGFRIQHCERMLVLYTHTGETMTLIYADNGSVCRWELRTPLESDPIQILGYEFK